MEDDNPTSPKNLRAGRTVARSFARMAATEDGKRCLAYLEQTIGWDEAGPPSGDANPIHFWTGQRSVVKLVRDQVSKGKKLLANPNDTDDEDEP